MEQQKTKLPNQFCSIAKKDYRQNKWSIEIIAKAGSNSNGIVPSVKLKVIDALNDDVKFPRRPVRKILLLL